MAAGVCGQRALEGRPIGQICPGTLEQLQGGFDSTLNLLLGLLFQLSTLLLVLAGPVPPQPLASTNTVFRPNAGTDAGEVPPVTPLSER